jgi:hypothetical protein
LRTCAKRKGQTMTSGEEPDNRTELTD